MHGTPLKTSRDSDYAYRQNTAYPLPASLSAQVTALFLILWLA
jgi:hypothetical protein